MRTAWTFVGLAAGVLAVSPVAMAHELECEKTVNGEVLLELDTYPTTLNYRLTVRNIHPDSASIVESAEDPLLEGLGFGGFSTPFTLPFGDEDTETFPLVIDDFEECERVAALDGVDDGIIDNTFTVTWDSGSDICEASVVCVPPNGPVSGQRMTGGGSVFGTGQNRITHGFQIRCDADDVRQNLEVNRNLPGPGADNFHLLDMTSATCIDDPALDEENPVAGFDTYIGVGTGTWNGLPGYTIEFTFTDDGEPGTDDFADMVIRAPGGAIVLDVAGDLNFGNHQAHP